MTTEIAKFRGEDLSLCIESSLVHYDSRPSFLNITKSLQEFDRRYYYYGEGSLYVDEGAGVCFAALLIAEFNATSLEHIKLGEYSVFIPLDLTVYYAKVRRHENFTLVISESLIPIEDALAEAHNNLLSAIVFQGGELTENFIASRFAPEEDIDIAAVINDFRLKKGRSVNSLLGYAVCAILAIVAATIATDYLSQNDLDDETVVVVPPKGQVALGHGLREMQKVLITADVLLAHGLTNIRLPEGPPPRPRLISLSGMYQPQSSYSRLSALAAHYAAPAKFSVGSDGWDIKNIKIPTFNGEEQLLRPSVYEDIDRLASVLQTFSNDVNFKRPISKGRHILYPLSVQLEYPNAALLGAIAEAVETLPVHASVGGYTLTTTPNAAYEKANITIYVKGPN